MVVMDGLEAFTDGGPESGTLVKPQVMGGRIRHGREPRRKRTDGVAKRNPGFFDRVYALVSLIPYGKVATYGQIARLLGAPRAARTVGWAMHGNPHGERVPCHRVIQRSGTCSPYFCVGDPDAQRRLLEREGVEFLLNGRVNLDVHQWRPGGGVEGESRRRKTQPSRRAGG